MSDALAAREAGDFEGARENLLKLLESSPDDAGLKRLLENVEASLEASASRPAPTPAPRHAPVRTPTQTETRRISIPPSDPRSSAEVEVIEVEAPTPQEVEVIAPPAGFAAPGQPYDDRYSAEFESLLMEYDGRETEKQRIQALLDETNAFRGLAAQQAREDDYQSAILSLRRASEELERELPNHPAAANIQPELQQELAEMYLGYARYQLAQGDLDGASESLEQYAELSPNKPHARHTALRMEREVLDPAQLSIAEISPDFVAEQREVREMLRVGRAQFLNGDIIGAENTFRQVEAIDVYNAEAKSMLARIAEEKRRRNHLDRLKTRTQMLEEVGSGWQRPQIYVDRARDVDVAAEQLPLERKLEQIRIPTVNFPGVPLSRAINTLSQISAEYDMADATGVNIVAMDPDRTDPLVYIDVRNLSLKRILDLVVDSVKFQYEVEEDAVIVRPGVRRRQDLQTENFPVSPATVQRLMGRAAPQQAEAVQVDDPFAAPTAAPAPEAAGPNGGGRDDSRSLRDFLQQAAGVDFSVPGSSLIYDGTDIWVTQTPRNLERIRNVFRRLTDVRQVEIEARFLEVADSTVDELGFNWNVITPGGTSQYQSNNRSLAGAFAGQQGASEIRIGDQSFPVSPPSIPGVPGLGAGAGNFAVIDGSADGFDIRATIRMLSQRTGSDLLSAPKLTVLSGHQATIRVAQELRYPDSYGDTQSEVGRGGTGEAGSAGVTITPGTPQDFQMRPVGVELSVTPTVEQDSSVTLDLNPRVTEFEGFVEYGGQSVAISGGQVVSAPSGFFQPIFATREVNTKVNIWDGATVVMGGLTREEVRRVDDKVPVLGDIPVFGRFFRSQGEASQKRNLLIFVTANLVSPGGSPMRQQLRTVEPGALFQNPTIVLPSGAVARERREE